MATYLVGTVPYLLQRCVVMVIPNLPAMPMVPVQVPHHPIVRMASSAVRVVEMGCFMGEILLISGSSFAHLHTRTIR